MSSHQSTPDPPQLPGGASKRHLPKTKTGCKTCKRRKIKVRRRRHPRTSSRPARNKPPCSHLTRPVRRGAAVMPQLHQAQRRLRLSPLPQAHKPLAHPDLGPRRPQHARPRAPPKLHHRHLLDLFQRPPPAGFLAAHRAHHGPAVRLCHALRAGPLGAAPRLLPARAPRVLRFHGAEVSPDCVEEGNAPAGACDGGVGREPLCFFHTHNMRR